MARSKRETLKKISAQEARERGSASAMRTLAPLVRGFGELLGENDFDPKAVQFFYDNAGYSYDRKWQKPEEGKWENAYLLAMSESWARDNGYDFQVHPEDDSESEVWISMEDENGEIVQSLGGVALGDDDWDNDQFLRVLQAEMALAELLEKKSSKQNPRRRGKSKSKKNPYMGDAVELAKYRKERDAWEKSGRKTPPPRKPRKNPEVRMAKIANPSGRTPIGIIGDNNPIEHWGGIVYETEYGYEMLYFRSVEDDVYIYQVSIEDDAWSDLDWVDWDGVSSYIDIPVSEIKKAAQGDNVLGRAQVYESAASYHGWDNLDEQPQVMSIDDAEERYGEDADRAHQAWSRRAKNPACGSGKILVKRKGYVRSTGTKVRPTSFCIKDRGRKGRGPKVIPELREGKLGGSGYTSKSVAARHKLLDSCVKKYGYRSCLGSLQSMAVLGKREMSEAKLKKIADDRKWLVKKYGGPGSFSRQANPRVRNLANRLSNP